MEKWLPAEGLWFDGGFIRHADSGIMHRAKWSMKDVELMRCASHLVGNDLILTFLAYLPLTTLLDSSCLPRKRVARGLHPTRLPPNGRQTDCIKLIPDELPADACGRS